MQIIPPKACKDESITTLQSHYAKKAMAPSKDQQK